MSSRAPAGISPARAWAEEAHALVQAQPQQALRLAERALATASDDGDVGAEISARYALAWAQHSLGRARAGKATLRAGIRLAERHGDRLGAGLLRRHLAYQLSVDGRQRAAKRELEAAIALLPALERARSEVHRLVIHRMSQTPDPELQHATSSGAARALRTLRRRGDALWEARLRYNLGALSYDRGELKQAETHFRRAFTLYSGAGAEAAAADSILALAEIALVRGDVLGCLKTLAEVELMLPPEYVYSNLDECRVKALVQARLLPEARAAAEAYVALCRQTGRAEFAAAATLDVAAIALMDGDAAAAHALALQAARSYAARGKPVNAALARAAALRALLASGSAGRAGVRAGLAAAKTLERAGWHQDTLRTRLLVSRLALAAGSRSTARRQFELARALGSRGALADRVEWFHVAALLSAADGEPARSEIRLQQGLKLLDSYRSALGAIELRATASQIGAELAQTGLRLAVESKRPEKILAWAEQLRAGALRLPAVRPPSDVQLAALQTDLRRAVTRGDGVARARLEAAIRNRYRLVEPTGAVQTAIGDARTAQEALGECTLVEYIGLDARYSAVTLSAGGFELHELGDTDATRELEWLRFAYARLAPGRLTSDQRDTYRRNAEASADALDRLLVRPLAERIGHAPLVIVPTGALHAVPWAALPSLRGRPFVVAPSLATWRSLAGKPRTRRRKATFVAGPRLRHAAVEVRELGALLPGATVLHGKAATAAATLKVLDGAALAHLACHGHFRADSPLFSSLELADGRLNVYELQSLHRAPDLVVLSACDLALSTLHPGDELLGFAAALLGMGTR
ncbi:MAG TPA: CHAT domain-containing protein, partial [Gaiellaceae bacterium]|nr:CHAT domain-containing protein [Gaiellaceae bacterium]